MDENTNINIEHQAKERECYVLINGVVHRLSCTITEVGEFELCLDDKCIVSERYWLIKLKGFDCAIEIGGETIHCVFDEEKLDVAINGRYLKKQRNYIPLRAVYIICAALCIMIPVMFFMALTRKMDEIVLALVLVIAGGSRIYYNIKNRESKTQGDRV